MGMATSTLLATTASLAALPTAAAGSDSDAPSSFRLVGEDIVVSKIFAWSLTQEQARIKADILEASPDIPRLITKLRMCCGSPAELEKSCLGKLARRLNANIEKMNEVCDEEKQRFEAEILPMWTNRGMSAEERAALPAWQKAEEFLWSASVQQEALYEDRQRMLEVLKRKFGLTWDELIASQDADLIFEEGVATEGSCVPGFKASKLLTYHLGRKYGKAKVAIVKSIKSGIKPVALFKLPNGSPAELEALSFKQLYTRFQANNKTLGTICEEEKDKFREGTIMRLWTKHTPEERAAMPEWADIELYFLTLVQKQQVLDDEQGLLNEIMDRKYGISIKITDDPARPPLKDE